MLSAVLFAAVTFLFAFYLGFAYVDFWMPRWINERNSLPSPDQRNSVVLWTAFACAFAAAGFAGWAWRTPTATRFHCCFWAGLCLLGISLTYTCQVNKLVGKVMYAYAWVDASYWGFAILLAPLLCTVTASLGLILLLAALYLDQVHWLPTHYRSTRR